MALWLGSAWIVVCLAAIVVAKRSERGFLLFGFLTAAVAMSIAIATTRGLTDRPADTESTEYVELRNHSSSTIHVVATGDDGRDTLLGSVGGRSRMFLAAERSGPRFCLPELTEAIILRPGASLRTGSAKLVGPNDRTVNFTLAGCYGSGLTVVTWDGGEAYEDVNGKPYLLDSRTSRVLIGFAIGAVALLLAWLVDCRPLRPRTRDTHSGLSGSPVSLHR